MLFSFCSITNGFETSTPLCCLMIRWHSIKFGILSTHFWSCEWATSLSPALHGWGKATQQPGKWIDGKLIIALWLENWHLVELRGEKNLTKTTATTTKLHSIPESQKDHRVPLNPRNQVQVDADTQRCEEGMWKSMRITVRAPCAIHPWILLHPPLTFCFSASPPNPALCVLSA